MTNEQAYKIAMEAIDKAYENERPLLYLIPPKEDIEMVELSGTIHMHEPEPFDECDYDSPTHLHTIGFFKVFGKEAITIAITAFEMIKEKYGSKAEYMINFDYEYPNGEKVDFRIVNDVDTVTVLLPCEN